MARQNTRWIRSQGIRQLVEEHELHPLGRAVQAAEKALWRHKHPRSPGTATAVLLSGVPRSGTNMIVRGLAELPELEVYNEGDRSAFHRYRLRSDDRVCELVHRSRHELVLFKPLLDSHRVAGLLGRLGAPDRARALWAYRDVDGRARSALRKFGSSALVVLTEIAGSEASLRWQAQGMTEETHGLLRGMDWDRLTPADGAAVMWLVRNQLFFDQGLASREDTMALSYDAVVHNPAKIIRAVCAHLGVEFRPSMVAQIDQRAARNRTRLDLHADVRKLCDEMTERLDAAAEAALLRLHVES